MADREYVPLVGGKSYKLLNEAGKFLTMIALLCNGTRAMVYFQQGEQFVRDDRLNINLASDYKSAFSPTYKFKHDPGAGLEDIDGICNFGDSDDRATASQMPFREAGGNKGAGLYIPVKLLNPATKKFERALIVIEREFWRRGADPTWRWRESYLDKELKRTPVSAGDEVFDDESIRISTLLTRSFGSQLFSGQGADDQTRKAGIDSLRKGARKLAENKISSSRIKRMMVDEMLAYFPDELRRHVKSVGACTKALAQAILENGDNDTKQLLHSQIRNDPSELDVVYFEWLMHDIGKMFTPKSWFCVPDVEPPDGKEPDGVTSRTEGQKRRSKRHPIGSYMIMDAIPGLFHYSEDAPRHHYDRYFAVPQSYIAAIGAIADFSSALMDPRVENKRSHTLLEAYTVIGNVMLELIEKNDLAQKGEAVAEMSTKSLALMVHAYTRFLKYGVMEEYAVANVHFPASFVRDAEHGVKQHQERTGGVQFSPTHTLEHLNGEIANRPINITNLLNATGIDKKNTHETTRQKLLEYFEEVLQRPDMQECLHEERELRRDRTFLERMAIRVADSYNMAAGMPMGFR